MTLTYDPDRSCYDTVAAAIDEQWFDRQPWQMYGWHPDGAHLQHLGQPVAVVVTDWTADDSYDIGIYCAADDTDDALMDEAIEYLSVPTDALPAVLRGLIDGEAVRITERARIARAVPITADRLAAHYLRDVRRNGWQNVQNVAEAADGSSAYWEIYHEITEGWNGDAARRGVPEFRPESSEVDRRRCEAAAAFAIVCCRIEMGRFGA